MISARLLINQKGEVVIQRLYRDDVSKNTADAFRMQVVARKEAGALAPVRMIDGSTFMHTRHGDLYFVAVTKSNVNAALVFQFLYQLIQIFSAYFGTKFDENSIKNNFTLVYELLDETLDFGYPQNCSIDVLKLYINLGKIRAQALKESSQLTSQITGAIDWRRPDIKYKKNKVYIDVLESVNLLLSADGNVLKADVSGQVAMKAYISGMPECKFGLNDKIILDNEAKSGKARKHNGVNIDDCTFHRCVRLGNFDVDRTITFIPPDGEFELMQYRITETVNLPFRVIPVIEERGKTRVTYNIKVIANFASKLIATNVIFKIPCPATTARAKIDVHIGKAKYDPAQRAIVWKIRRFAGASEYSFNGEVELMASTRDKVWSRPPIQVEFQVPMFTASGLKVLFLKVLEKNNFKTVKWVRYVTRAGQYQIRI